MNTQIVSIGIDAANFPVRPESAHEEDGYVYIVEFSDKTIKVGRSGKPNLRLHQHRHDAAKFGLSISQWWVSGLHRGFAASEAALTRFALDAGALQGGNEYFKDLSFSAARTFAEGFDIRTSDHLEVEAYETRREESLRRIKEATSRVAQDTRKHVRVSGDSAAWVLSTFFDPLAELPVFENSMTPEENIAMAEVAVGLAERAGVTGDDVYEWGSYNYLCRILDTLVESAKLEMKIRINREDRSDMYAPWFGPDGMPRA